MMTPALKMHLNPSVPGQETRMPAPSFRSLNLQLTKFISAFVQEFPEETVEE